MHLGNEAITPECAALTLLGAGIGLAAAGVQIRRQPASREQIALAAGLGALVFAAQAINVPVLPGASAHLVGGVLLAWMLGPGLGAWTMAVVLLVQAVVLGDGGLAAYGANVMNMALLPAGAVALGRRLHVAEGRWSMATCGLLAAITVPLAAVLIVGQTALLRGGAELGDWTNFATRMIGTHLWIGVLEGGLTVAAVVALNWLGKPASARAWQPAMAAAVAAMALAAIVAPWSTALPDGYESAAAAAGLDQLLAEGTSAAAEVQSTAVAAIQRASLGEHPALIVATLLTAALVATAGLALSSRRIEHAI
jgi:cobalt/nickel transport system permease protein